MSVAAEPKVCGNYLLLERIGSGGMAEVFRAKTVGSGGSQRIVAIKKILPVLAEDKRFIAMFVDEARIAVELTHTHIVQIFEFGLTGGEYYIAMEYVHGRDLRQVMKDLAKQGRAVPIPAAAYIATCVSSAIDFAHRKTSLDGQALNIVHRDVSPPNVLLGFDGSVKVVDFGIALANHRVSDTGGAKLKGKIAYMSPEQARGNKLDRRSDIYSLGTVMFEMLTGELPYPGGGNNFALLARVREADIRQPRQVHPDIPLGFESVLLKALRRQPEARYSWASEIADELQPLLIHGHRRFGSKELGAFVKSLYQEAADSETEHLEELLADPSQVLERPREPVDWSGVDGTHIVEMDAGHDTVILATNPPRPAGANIDSDELDFLDDPTAVTLLADSDGIPAANARETVKVDDVDLDFARRTEKVELGDRLAEASAVAAPEPAKQASSGKDRILITAASFVVLMALGAGLVPANTRDLLPEAASAVLDSVLPGGEAPARGEAGVGAGPKAPETIAAKAPETVAPEPELGAGVEPESVSREHLSKLRKSLLAAMREKGVVRGDDATVDRFRVASKKAFKAGDLVEAWHAGEKALEAVAALEVDEGFVKRKLSRLKRRANRTGGETRRQADRILVGVDTSDPEAANRRLNDAFQLLRGRFE
jgi:serine/threonine protein kinase